MRIKPPYTAREILLLFHPAHAAQGHDPSRKHYFSKPEPRFDIACSCGEYLMIKASMISAAGLTPSHVRQGLRNTPEGAV